MVRDKVSNIAKILTPPPPPFSFPTTFKQKLVLEVTLMMALIVGYALSQVIHRIQSEIYFVIPD